MVGALNLISVDKLYKNVLSQPYRKRGYKNDQSGSIFIVHKTPKAVSTDTGHEITFRIEIEDMSRSVDSSNLDKMCVVPKI